MINNHYSILCVGILLLVAVPTATASGTISNALSARSAGRGGTNLAFADNGVVLMDNAAGLESLIGNTSGQDTYIDLGGVGLFTDMNYRDEDNPRTDAYDNPSGLGHFMMGRRISEEIVFGFGAFAPAGFASDYDLQGRPASLPGEHHYYSFGALVRLLPGLSLRLTDRLTVGGTFGIAVSHIEIEGPYYLNSLPLRGTPTMLDLQSTGPALSWSCGMQYALTDRTTIGARYQSENEFTSTGKANVTIAGLGDSDYDVNVGLTWARSAGIGIKHDVDPCNRFSIDFIWEDWSDAYDSANLSFTNPSNPVFEMVAGPAIDEVFPLLWKDALIVSSGYEHDFGLDQTFRLGYRYQDNPVSSSTASTYLQTTLEHHFSIGYGFKHSGWLIDTAYQFAFAPDVHTQASVYPGGDYSNAVLKTQTHMVFLSAMRRF